MRERIADCTPFGFPSVSGRSAIFEFERQRIDGQVAACSNSPLLILSYVGRLLPAALATHPTFKHVDGTSSPVVIQPVKP